MGTHYDHLELEARCTIARLHEGGQSCRQIAAALDRTPSTISRELKRNRGAQVGYKPAYAQEQTQARRWTGSRLERDDALRDRVLGCLKRGWSPQQVAGWMKRLKDGSATVSHETIYRFIYAQIARHTDGSWRSYLPKAKFKRGWRRKPGGSPASFIKDRVSISERSRDAKSRRKQGHWEADLMLFSTYGQAILALHERKSRLLLMAIQPSKAALPTIEQLLAWLQPLGHDLCKTLTFDNGTEFALHYQLNALGIQTFFCDPHSPWQKGGVENAIGRMRRPMPRKTDLTTIDRAALEGYVAAYNNTPRKCLGFRTPAQAFFSQVLHFKCESIGRPSPA
ncbi:MAG: transposase, family [Acetobacteraceae bacterium]|jgi:IS30 family transposase|nr:transposase, family [Acetobacteraceae bacterium]